MTADTLPHPALEVYCAMVFRDKENRATNAFTRVFDGDGDGDAVLHLQDSVSSFESLNIKDEYNFSGPLHLNYAQKTVSFPENPISEIWERPKTLPEDRNGLFYTGAEINAFRREYRALVSDKIAQRKAEMAASQGIVLPPQNTLFLILTFLQKATILATGSLSRSSLQSTSCHCQTETVLLVDTLYLF